MKTKRCYIAGKIGGLAEDEYKANFSIGKIEVEQLGMFPISPLDLPHNHERRWVDYMREDIAELMKCDCVYALSNWKDSPGATIEIELAQSLRIEIHYQ